MRRPNHTFNRTVCSGEFALQYRGQVEKEECRLAEQILELQISQYVLT